MADSNDSFAHLFGALFDKVQDQTRRNREEQRPIVEAITHKLSGDIDELAQMMHSKIGDLGEVRGKFDEFLAFVRETGEKVAPDSAGSSAPRTSRAPENPLHDMFRADRPDPKPAEADSNDPEAVLGLRYLRQEAATLTGLAENTPDMMLALALRQRRTR